MPLLSCISLRRGFHIQNLMAHSLQPFPLCLLLQQMRRWKWLLQQEKSRILSCACNSVSNHSFSPQKWWANSWFSFWYVACNYLTLAHCHSKFILWKFFTYNCIPYCTETVITMCHQFYFKVCLNITIIYFHVNNKYVNCDCGFNIITSISNFLWNIFWS